MGDIHNTHLGYSAVGSTGDTPDWENANAVTLRVACLCDAGARR